MRQIAEAQDGQANQRRDRMQDKQYPVLSKLPSFFVIQKRVQKTRRAISNTGGWKEHGKAGAVAAQVPDLKFVGPVRTPEH